MIRFIFGCLGAVLYLGMLLVSASASAAITFSNVSNQAGFTGNHTSFGASWGDVNGDGLPDIFTNNHLLQNSIYVNQPDGTFVESASQLDAGGFWTGAARWQDTHGATWMDYDNDGDQDLIVSVGVCCTIQFMVNENGQLYNRTAQLGFTGDADKEGRMPLWFDMDDDGLLELAMMTSFPVPLYKQSGGDFVDAIPGTGFYCNNDQFGTLIDIDGDGRMEVLCVKGGGDFATQVYDTSTLPFVNVAGQVPTVNGVNDVILGDFDRNQRTDMLLLKGALRPNEVAISGNNLEAHFAAAGGGKGFSFRSGGTLSVDLWWAKTWVNFGNIFIGSGNNHPTSESFVLNPSDPDVWGTPPCNTIPYPRVCIGYNPSTQVWTFRWEPGGEWVDTYFVVQSTAGMSQLSVQGITVNDRPIAATLLSNYQSGLANTTNASGMADPTLCVSGVAVDFDNDMDEDLYLVCRGGVQNLVNRLYENNGNGNFQLVPGAGGAGGVTGLSGTEHAGTSDSVIAADYDVDGRMDVFVVNGLNFRPRGGNYGGPDQLFRNTSDPRHWIEIDLVGTSSNRDGVGATVRATAGGITQMRAQYGGYHRWSQNHQRLHFGLAQYTQVDLQVNWPSGAVDTFTNVASNKLYRVTENGGIQEVTPGGGGGGGGGGQSGDECGQPSYNPAGEANLFLWKDCDGSQLWHVRVTAGGSTSVFNYTGNVASDTVFGSVTPFSLEASDILDYSTDPRVIEYGLIVVFSGQDGFDFVLPINADACFDLASKPAGTNVLLGSGRLAVTTPLDLQTLGACGNGGGPPPSDCGAPAYDGSTDDGIFIWKDCAQDRWSVRVVAAGGYKRAIGGLTADTAFQNVQGVSVESTDVLSNAPSSVIDYDLRVVPPWFDGFDFSVPCSANVTFDLDSPAADIYVGPNREQVAAPFTLTDYGGCQ